MRRYPITVGHMLHKNPNVVTNVVILRCFVIPRCFVILRCFVIPNAVRNLKSSHANLFPTSEFSPRST